MVGLFVELLFTPQGFGALSIGNAIVEIDEEKNKWGQLRGQHKM
jgi:hypothetical protein